MDQTANNQHVNHATFVVFGGTGDLMKKKLAPAFAQLIQSKTLTRDSLLVGIARGNFTNDTYKAMLLESAKTTAEREALSQLNILFYQADSSVKGTLRDLKPVLEAAESPSGHQRIFYLATSYTLFAGIVDNLVDAKLDKHKHGVKVVFEKPFGSDLQSAKKIERKLHSVFDEDHLYRIDHYLGKESVQNILMFKFANPMIDGLFNNKHISKIEIHADESVDVGSRLGYYNGVGAVKDMIQSHLLQIAALVLMQTPQTLSANEVRDAKVAVLKKLSLAPASEQLLGAYKSFAEELKMHNLADLSTETFAQLTFVSSAPQWKGVPIIIRSGKKLKTKSGKVIIHFKNNKAVDASQAIHGIKHIHHNRLIFDIAPTQDIVLSVNLRRAAQIGVVDTVALKFNSQEHYGPSSTDGYARMLADIVAGEKLLFTRTDEVLASWKAVEGLTQMRPHVRFVTYEDHSAPEDVR